MNDKSEDIRIYLHMFYSYIKFCNDKNVLIKNINPNNKPLIDSDINALLIEKKTVLLMVIICKGN